MAHHLVPTVTHTDAPSGGPAAGTSGSSKDAAAGGLQLSRAGTDAAFCIDNPPESSAAVPLMQQEPSLKRNATWADVLYHSITAMIGAGVLGLPAALSHLGWIGGACFLTFSIVVSWYTYKLLVYMHEVPDLGSKVGGIRRLDRYDQLADYVLGPKRGKAVLLPFQLAVLVGIAVTYTVVGGDSLAAFAGFLTPAGGAKLGRTSYYLMFGGMQLLLSMLPSMHDARLVSLMGALMSAAYCTIAVVMSAAVKPGPEVNYNPAVVARSPIERVMGIFNALTTVLFAYGGHNVALEIQATIPVGGKHPLTTVPAMMRGVNVTFVVTGLCYFLVSIVGFYAFGTAVSDNVLAAFEHGPRSGVVAAADIMVVVHVGAAYQVYTQPLFALVEGTIKGRRADRDIPLLLQFGLRVVYVCLVTFLACLLPFFGALMGLVGAVAITPTTFLLPPLLWVLYKQPARGSLDWAVNWGLVWVTGALGVLGTIGAVYTITTAWGTFRVFSM